MNLIIGHTTESTSRVWVQGNARHRSVALKVREISENSHASSTATKTIDLPREYDFIEVSEFEGLKSGTEYSVEAEFNPRGPTGSKNSVKGGFRTFSKHDPQNEVAFSFILASCNLSIVSINNLLAKLIAYGGVVAAGRSLKRPVESWSLPFRWLAWIWGLVGIIANFLMKALIWFVNKATELKQPGKPYLRSPFLKLCELFDSVKIEFEKGSRPPAVGDVICLDGKDDCGVLAYNAIVTEGDWSKETAKGKLVLTRVTGEFDQPGSLTIEKEQIGVATSASRRKKPWFNRPEFIIHAGDQIYYDFPYTDRFPSHDQYRLAYREAWFEDESLGHFLAQYPNYMILDDHEIVDQFPADSVARRKDVGSKEYLEAASAAYEDYVHKRNPSPKDNPKPLEKSRTGPFHYKFDRGKARFFVLDTRTRRRSGEPNPRMVDEDQMELLLEWMERYKTDLKFVVSSVPFVAHVRGEEKTTKWFHGPHDNDKWSGEVFKGQRHRIIELIKSAGVERLVFLTGDMHCCYHATMRIGDGTKYEKTTVHELAGGPIYQLQMADTEQFEARCSGTTVKDGVSYQVELNEIHAAANAVMHIDVNYKKRTGTGLDSPPTPEVRWHVIRTLVEPSTPGAEDRPRDEPAMAGCISFNEARNSNEARNAKSLDEWST